MNADMDMGWVHPLVEWGWVGPILTAAQCERMLNIIC